MPMGAKKIYVTGATGKLGSEVLKEFPTSVPLVRKKSGLRKEMVTDFSEEDLQRKLKDCDVLVHVAGSTRFNSKRTLYETNVSLTKKLMAALPADSRIIFASSISVYGKRLRKKPGDEKTQVNPDSAYAHSKLYAERIVSKHRDHVILRIGPLYGPQFKDYVSMLKLMKKGFAFIIGPGWNRVPFTHVRDAAHSFRLALDAPSGVYVITGEAVRQDKIYQIAEKKLGVGVAHFNLPLLFGRVAARLVPRLSDEHINVLFYDRPFNISKARKVLGFRPTPIEKGIKEVVDSMGSRK